MRFFCRSAATVGLALMRVAFTLYLHGGSRIYAAQSGYGVAWSHGVSSETSQSALTCVTEAKAERQGVESAGHRGCVSTRCEAARANMRAQAWAWTRAGMIMCEEDAPTERRLPAHQPPRLRHRHRRRHRRCHHHHCCHHRPQPQRPQAAVPAEQRW